MCEKIERKGPHRCAYMLKLDAIMIRAHLHLDWRGITFSLRGHGSCGTHAARFCMAPNHIVYT
ncbi:MAG: hypothetical protein ACXWCX_05540 [Burkholderiales bacterium]